MFCNFRKGIRIRIEGTLAVKNDIGIEVEVGDALCVRVGVHDSLHLGVVDIFRNAHFGDVLHIYGISRPPIPNDGLVARFINTIAFAVGVRQFEQDRKAALAGKYNYLNPKKSATVPSEYIKQVLMRGTGFIGGKGRVCKIFETEIDAGTRAKRIKAEYGQGGAGCSYFLSTQTPKQYL